jgi:hypothetical protein
MALLLYLKVALTYLLPLVILWSLFYLFGWPLVAFLFDYKPEKPKKLRKSSSTDGSRAAEGAGMAAEG